MLAQPLEERRRGRKHEMINRFAGVAAALLVLLLPFAEASAQYSNRGQNERGGRAEPGVFDYYVLTLSWSPTYCAEQGNTRNDPQCRPRSERPYAFVLHGLWPQHERGWPQDCRSPDRGFVPRPVARRMLDIMPSEQLVFHEYRKHGTCTGLGVDGYFDLARRFYDQVKIPRRYVTLREDRLFVGRDELVREFVEINPGLKPDMIAVACGGSGNRLKEVRVCFDKGGRFRACGENENQRRLCTADRMYVPPVRAGSPSDRGDGDERRPPREIVPGPREERRL
jgi:ribonuclease T2